MGGCGKAKDCSLYIGSEGILLLRADRNTEDLYLLTASAKNEIADAFRCSVYVARWVGTWRRASLEHTALGAYTGQCFCR